jgi:DNA-binding IclR family transcriptional regulator
MIPKGYRPPSMAGPRGQVQVLSKMGDVLALLAQRGSSKAAEIADAIGEPRSSVYRLLRTLRELGYVDSRRRGEYELGMRLFELGSHVAARFSIRQAALHSMEALHESSDGTILLFIHRDERAVCIERLDGRWVRFEIVDVGESLPLHTGAAPRTLLAFAGDSMIDEYLEDARLEATTDRSPTTPRHVRSLLAEVRARDYAVSDQDLVLGVASIAAPIRDHTGAVVAAISYSDIAKTLLGENRQRSIDMIVEAARAASLRLGWIPAGIETGLEPLEPSARALR